jgi:hypothetical protein
MPLRATVRVVHGHNMQEFENSCKGRWEAGASPLKALNALQAVCFWKAKQRCTARVQGGADSTLSRALAVLRPIGTGL